MAGWLAVVSQDHVDRAVSLGIAQVNHGRRGPLASMHAGDRLVYYSPRTSMRGGSPLRAFTALATFPDDDLWQADEGEFRPWRRRASYVAEARPAPVDELRGALELTAAPNWGYQLRRGLVPLSDHDVDLAAEAMGIP